MRRGAPRFTLAFMRHVAALYHASYMVSLNTSNINLTLHIIK
jgi:hypothetical protein